MNRPLAFTPDVERRVVDYLNVELADEQVDIGVDLPRSWKPGDTEFLQVSWDGTPTQVRPVVSWPTVRCTAWAGSKSAAKRLAALAEGHLLAYPGGDEFVNVTSLVGVQPARDPDNDRAELAWFTVRAGVRTVPSLD